MTKEELKPYANKALALLAGGAEKFALLCRKLMFTLDAEEPVKEEPKWQRFTLADFAGQMEPFNEYLKKNGFTSDESDTYRSNETLESLKKKHEASELKADSELANKIADVKENTYIPIQDLPTDLYIAEYFTVPTALRVYGALLQIYKTELITLIQQRVGCGEHKAGYILQSMEYYLTQLKAGNSGVFKGQTAWLTDYAKMVKIINGQDAISLADRASATINLLANLEEIPDVLKERGELLATIKCTGALPAQIPVLLLDIIAFVEIPKYLKRRVESINVHLNSSMQIRGEFNVN